MGNWVLMQFLGAQTILIWTYDTVSFQIPDPSQTTEYKKGYIMRKCCLEPDGRKSKILNPCTVRY